MRAEELSLLESERLGQELLAQLPAPPKGRSTLDRAGQSAVRQISRTGRINLQEML